MSMTSSPLIILLSLFLLASFSDSLIPKPSSESAKDWAAAEKTRLGSRPPSCHNKCNECHPCMAVQVPTLPSHSRVGPLDNRYSNYKPLGWKCRCAGHFYNP
ncbi:hypothetical protein AAHA92_01104 [Salvia divinorum]|uniref:Epidermal patterning factor-like protein n=1 Tax=Salvia divinorum TaxID=28513 RepID=A0ABD1ILU4_SALDI